MLYVNVQVNQAMKDGPLGVPVNSIFKGKDGEYVWNAVN